MHHLIVKRFTLLLVILLVTVVGGVASALLASTFLLAGAQVRNRLLPHLVSFATGALLGAAFIGLLPRAIETAGAGNAGKIGLAVLGGLLAFFILEKLVLWRHCHHDSCEVHTHDEAAGQHADFGIARRFVRMAMCMMRTSQVYLPPEMRSTHS